METIPTPQNLQDPNLSDGSELMPAEVEARAQREGTVPPSATTQPSTTAKEVLRTTDGYTVDQEGLANNYPVTPPVYTQKRARFGFTEYAEQVNGRLAMIGFISLIALELAMGQGFLSLLS